MPSRIENLIKDPLTPQIGQMIMVGFEGQDPQEEWPSLVTQQVKQGLIGGVILFGHNITTSQQTKILATALQDSSPKSLPLLIAVDQEGGKVERLTEAKGFHSSPRAKEIAAHSLNADEIYNLMASQLSKYGINLNFGPVVDLDLRKVSGESVCSVIGGFGRSYSDNPDIVIHYAKSFIDAHRTYDIITSLKHYPGHGSASGDTHEATATHGYVEDLKLIHLPDEEKPFKELIKSGHADTIMVAHVIAPGVDQNTPASLSKKLINQRLREEYGFQGVVITDCLHMGAIQQNYSLEDIVIQAIQAGNDLLIFSNNPHITKKIPDFKADPQLPLKIIKIVHKAIEEGKITPKRIEESYQRLMKLKGRIKPLAKKRG